MQRLSRLATVVALVALFAAPAAVAAQETPDSLLEAFVAAVNGRDEEAALALFADDASVTVDFGDELFGTQTFTGKENLQLNFGSDGDDPTARLELEGLEVNGDTATVTFLLYGEALAQAGLEPGEGTLELVAQDGLIHSLTLTASPEWVARIQAALAADLVDGGVPDGGLDDMGKGPGELPATGNPIDPLPLTLAAGALLLFGGFMVRRLRPLG